MAIHEDRVRVDVADHVATVTLSRPEKHNALDGLMFQGIVAAAAEVAAVVPASGAAPADGCTVAGAHAASPITAAAVPQLRMVMMFAEKVNHLRRAAR